MWQIIFSISVSELGTSFNLSKEMRFHREAYTLIRVDDIYGIFGSILHM